MSKRVTCPECERNCSEADQDVDSATLKFVGDGTDNVQCWFSCECGRTWLQIFEPK